MIRYVWFDKRGRQYGDFYKTAKDAYFWKTQEVIALEQAIEHAERRNRPTAQLQRMVDRRIGLVLKRAEIKLTNVFK